MMTDEFFKKPYKRPIIELNIVPILDMLTTVIFFLLLSISFIELTKITVPPSSTVMLDKPLEKKPLLPKLFLNHLLPEEESEQVLPRASAQVLPMKVTLSWQGDSPGQLVREIHSTIAKERRASIIKNSSDLTRSFKLKFPEEKTLRIGLHRRLLFQDLISAIDGAHEVFPDTVLISYSEVDFHDAAKGPASVNSEKRKKVFDP